MVLINQNKVFWREIILYLFLIVIIGPWSYESINVPAQYDCSGLSFRLEGDYCGVPLSGIRVIAVGLGIIIDTAGEIVVGTALPPHLARNLWSLFVLLLPLPTISTFLLFLPGKRHRQQRFQVVTWSVATGGGFLFLAWTSLMRKGLPIQMWGFWGYFLLSLAALIMEIVVWFNWRKIGLGKVIGG